ncbi:MAG: hypothetical protein M3R15_10580 [Acidobacteriota bacterium]|nr:hypothetical protein [Acidobacteriota bacterium]
MNKHAVESGSGVDRELLVILSGDRAEESFKQVSASYQVQHEASPRVFVVEGDQSELAKLRSISGVLAATAGDLPPEVLKSLDDGETLFVGAWLSRIKEGSSKQRRGEGLSWDAPGFVPPDPPADDSEQSK